MMSPFVTLHHIIRLITQPPSSKQLCFRISSGIATQETPDEKALLGKIRPDHEFGNKYVLFRVRSVEYSGLVITRAVLESSTLTRHRQIRNRNQLYGHKIRQISWWNVIKVIKQLKAQKDNDDWSFQRLANWFSEVPAAWPCVNFVVSMISKFSLLLSSLALYNCSKVLKFKVILLLRWLIKALHSPSIFLSSLSIPVSLSTLITVLCHLPEWFLNYVYRLNLLLRVDQIIFVSCSWAGPGIGCDSVGRPVLYLWTVIHA